MKQYITVEQLDELNPEQKKRLRGWWFAPDEGDHAVSDGVQFTVIDDREDHDTDARFLVGVPEFTTDIKWFNYDNCLPLLSMGQCIELLNSRTKEQAIGYNDSGCFWSAYIGRRGTGSMISGCINGIYNNDELIDALWQPIKVVL